MSNYSFAEFKQRVHQSKSERMVVDGIYRLERNISVVISYLLVRLFPAIRPNVISVANVLLVWIAFGLGFGGEVTNPWILALIQLLILKITTIGDRVDGEIARYKNYYTQSGLYYDLTYHFFYPFVFLFSVGQAFADYFSSPTIFLLVITVGLLMTYQRMFGKLRHHIAYKIKLEFHQHELRDYVTENKPSSGRSWLRFVHYLLFFVYDWAWFFYLLLVLGMIFSVTGLLWVYLAHLVILFVVLVYQILVRYPQQHLFGRRDFE